MHLLGASSMKILFNTPKKGCHVEFLFVIAFLSQSIVFDYKPKSGKYIKESVVLGKNLVWSATISSPYLPHPNAATCFAISSFNKMHLFPVYDVQLCIWF